MRTTLWIVPVAVALVTGACHTAPAPQVALQPQVDSSALAERARQDSIARAEAEARAREAAERRAAQRRADSLADLKQRSEDLKGLLASMVHFDFDKSAIRPGDAGVLDEKIPILRANSQVRIQIAGNCDERGSDEYNLALGNRRAIAAKQYLVAHGIDASRVETVSYGEERPVDPGHDEEAWAKNRNDQFEILTANVVLREP
jgi:peptidoglycan-associated lipoprotein